MRREICGECGAPINDEGSCICTELLKRGWRRCAVGQKTTQWCAIAESVRGELREQRLVAALEAARAERDELRVRLEAIITAQQPPPAVDDFVATFRCESGNVVGTTTAKIHHVSRHDDGVIEASD